MLTMGYNAQRAGVILNTIDARTFFETALLILEYKKAPMFHKLPYVLVINPEDKTVNAPYLKRLFKEKIKKLLVINQKFDHFPKDMSAKHFAKELPEKTVKNAIAFLS